MCLRSSYFYLINISKISSKSMLNIIWRIYVLVLCILLYVFRTFALTLAMTTLYTFFRKVFFFFNRAISIYYKKENCYEGMLLYLHILWSFLFLVQRVFLKNSFISLERNIVLFKKKDNFIRNNNNNNSETSET